MKQNEQKNTNTVDDAALLSVLGGNNTAQDRLAGLLERKLQKEADEEEKAKAQAEAFRQAQLTSIRQQEEEIAARQAQCPHMKPNFKPALGGQKDHKGNFHLVCQYCNKEFGNDVPYYLRIPAEHIGGPQ